MAAKKKPLVPASIRVETPAAALTEPERQVIELIAGEGLPSKSAYLRVFPHAENDNKGSLHADIRSMLSRGQAYLKSLVEAGAQEAQIGRATLIQMALQDREFARETGNASAAVAATKNVAALAGISMKEPGEASAADPVALLEAVERLMRANRGEEAVVIDHGSNGE